MTVQCSVLSNCNCSSYQSLPLEGLKALTQRTSQDVTKLNAENCQLCHHHK